MDPCVIIGTFCRRHYPADIISQWPFRVRGLWFQSKQLWSFFDSSAYSLDRHFRHRRRRQVTALRGNLGVTFPRTKRRTIPGTSELTDEAKAARVVLAYCYPALVLFLCKVYNNGGILHKPQRYKSTEYKGTGADDLRKQYPRGRKGFIRRLVRRPVTAMVTDRGGLAHGLAARVRDQPRLVQH